MSQVPFGDLAFMPGTIRSASPLSVLMGIARSAPPQQGCACDGPDVAGHNLFVDRSVEQTRQIVSAAL
jgi:hypothetical protein